MPTGKTLLYVNESPLDPSNFYLSKLTASIGLLANAKRRIDRCPRRRCSGRRSKAAPLKELGRLFPSKTRYLTSAVSCKSALAPRTQRLSERHKN